MTQIVQAHPRQAGCFDKPHKGARQGSRRPRLMVGLNRQTCVSSDCRMPSRSNSSACFSRCRRSSSTASAGGNSTRAPRLRWLESTGFRHPACMGLSLSRVHHAIFVARCYSILLFDPRREHSSIPTAHCRRRRAQWRSRTALLQRRRRLVLDGREHGGRLPVIGWSAAR